MSFCSFSSQLIAENQTAVDNMFITSFMPSAPAECVKVYLYGLFACTVANPAHNTIEEFSKTLNMTPEDIESAFIYWQDQGLVQILDTIPFEVRFLPVKNANIKHPKIKDGKYNSFNLQAQEILSGRMITPNEYYEYYATMESLKIEPSALIMIIKYCVDLKGDNVGYSYILTVAKNWAQEGVTTAKAVEEKLLDYQKDSEDIAILTKTMGIKRALDTFEKDLFKKWLNMGFKPNVINYVAKTQKKSKNSVNFRYLDVILEKYFTMRLFDIMDIEQYESTKTRLYELAKNICKNLGVYYENVEPVVENYVSVWENMGFDDDTLLLISNYCFKNSVRTLEYMDKQILKFFKLGIVTTEALNNYFEDVLDTENKIKDILKKLGSDRNVNNIDREIYNNWVKLNIGEDIIDYALEIAKDKPKSLAFANKLILSWNKNGIKSAEEAKNNAPKQVKTTQPKRNYDNHEYTTSEINSLFTNLDEVEI